MLRIVGVQTSDKAHGEILLLQNQGSIRVHLRGHAVLSDAGFNSAELGQAAHAFGEDVYIPPGVYVALCTGVGRARWGRSRDGSTVYYAFMGRDEPIWSTCSRPLHVLGTQHTFEERSEVLLVH